MKLWVSTWRKGNWRQNYDWHAIWGLDGIPLHIAGFSLLPPVAGVGVSWSPTFMEGRERQREYGRREREGGRVVLWNQVQVGGTWKQISLLGKPFQNDIWVTRFQVCRVSATPLPLNIPAFPGPRQPPATDTLNYVGHILHPDRKSVV